MEIAQYVLLGFAPGLFWLWFFRRKDDYEPEPTSMVLRLFGLGVLAAFATILLGRFVLGPCFAPLLPSAPGPLRDLVDSFLLVALPEELLKGVAFFLGAYLSPELDEPLDGIVYGIAVGLGFATVENVSYLIAFEEPFLIVLRGFTATLGHVAFTGLLGYAVGLVKFRHGVRRLWLPLAGLGTAVWFHGLYDWFLELEGGARFLSLLVVLPFGLAVLGRKIRYARSRSPLYHPR